MGANRINPVALALKAIADGAFIHEKDGESHCSAWWRYSTLCKKIAKFVCREPDEMIETRGAGLIKVQGLSWSACDDPAHQRDAAFIQTIDEYEKECVEQLDKIDAIKARNRR